MISEETPIMDMNLSDTSVGILVMLRQFGEADVSTIRDRMNKSFRASTLESLAAVGLVECTNPLNNYHFKATRRYRITKKGLRAVVHFAPNFRKVFSDIAQGIAQKRIEDAQNMEVPVQAGETKIAAVWLPALFQWGAQVSSKGRVDFIYDDMPIVHAVETASGDIHLACGDIERFSHIATPKVSPDELITVIWYEQPLPFQIVRNYRTMYSYNTDMPEILSIKFIHRAYDPDHNYMAEQTVEIYEYGNRVNITPAYYNSLPMMEALTQQVAMATRTLRHKDES